MVIKEIDWDVEREIWNKTEQRIEKHHYIYDHSDFSLYTTEMTHEEHVRLHNCMRRAGIDIPHINRYYI